MRKFVRKALAKLDKMDKEQIRSLLIRTSQENDSLRMVLDSLTDGVLVTDRRNRLLLVNKAAERLLPFRSVDFDGEYIWDVLADTDIAEFFRRTLA